MLGVHKYQTEFKVGDRIVSAKSLRAGYDYKKGHETLSYSDIRIETIREIDETSKAMGHNITAKVGHDDKERKVIICRSSIQEYQESNQHPEWKVVWTDPLPEDDELALNYVKAVIQNRTTGKTGLFWTRNGGNNVIYAHMLSDSREFHEEIKVMSEYEKENYFSYSCHALLFKTEENLPEKTLFTGIVDKANLENGVMINDLASITILKSNIELDAASQIIADQEEKNPGNLMPYRKILEIEEVAFVKTLPSEALVLAWNDGERVSATVLGSSGYPFYQNEDPDAYAEETIPGPGLWAWRNVSMHVYRSYEGETDVSMEGDWEVADEKIITSLWGPLSDMDDEIREYTGDEDTNLTTKYTELAVQTLKEEEENENAHSG